MIQIEERRQTAEESSLIARKIEGLRATAFPSLGWRIGQFLCFTILGAVIGASLGNTILNSYGTGILSGLLLAILFGAFFVLPPKKKTPKRLRLLEEDSHSGKAQVWKVQAEKVTSFEKCFETKGMSNFFFKVGEKQVLFLVGRVLEEPVKRGRFPSSQFEISKAPASGMVFSLRTQGEPLGLTDVKRVPFLLEREPWPGDSLAALFEAEWDSLAALVETDGFEKVWQYY